MREHAVHAVGRSNLLPQHRDRVISGDKRVEAMRLADVFRARVVDTTLESFVFEITGAPEKVDAFIELMRPLGVIEVARTGVAAIARGGHV